MPNGRRLVESAHRVCGSAQDVAQYVHASMTSSDVADLASAPRGTDLLLEHRFWIIVRERTDMLDAGTATGDHEFRLQPQAKGGKGDESDAGRPEKDSWRMSWRTTPHWAAAPWILLDASADEALTGKLFAGSTVTFHEITAPLNLRTVAICDRTLSTSSLAPPDDAPDSKKTAAEALREKVRQALSLACHRYGALKVLCGATKRARQALFADWWKPANLEHGHF